MLKTVSDFIESLSAHEPEITQMRQLTCQTLIVAYREAKRKNPEIAESFITSFIQDYPGVAELLSSSWLDMFGESVLATAN